VEAGLPLFREHGRTLHCALAVESRALAVVESTMMDDVMMTELSSRYAVARRDGSAVLALIGAGLRDTSNVINDALAALAAWPIRYIIAGSSDHVVLVGLDESVAAEALVAVHARVFEVG
jgi:aspartokinase